MFVWNSESSIWNFDIKFDRERKLATEIKRRKKNKIGTERNTEEIEIITFCAGAQIVLMNLYVTPLWAKMSSEKQKYA